MNKDWRRLRTRIAGLMVAGLAVLSGAAGCQTEDSHDLADRITPRGVVLTGAFEPDYSGVSETGDRYPISTIRLGELAIPSGRLILSDGLGGFTDTPPLALAVPPGVWLVDLAVADTGSGGMRVALARLKWSDSPAVRWTMAHTADVDPETLAPDEVAGYPVDSGTGGFFDADAVAALKARHGANDVNAWMAVTDRWIAAGEAGGQRLQIPYLFAHVETIDGGGLALMSSGWGDGFYASWIGWNAQDQPVQLITDFEVIRAVDLP